MYDGASGRLAGQFAQCVSRLCRVDTCGTVENAAVILEGDDHRRFTEGKIYYGKIFARKNSVREKFRHNR